MILKPTPEMLEQARRPGKSNSILNWHSAVKQTVTLSKQSQFSIEVITVAIFANIP